MSAHDELRRIFANVDESRLDPEPDPCCGHCHKHVTVDFPREWNDGDLCPDCLLVVAEFARALVTQEPGQ
jgi:hypothetical protein